MQAVHQRLQQQEIISVRPINNSTQPRVYLDYNSTSPLATSVKEYLANGDFDFANPSALHTRGRQARKSLSQIKEKTLGFFSGRDSDLLINHSGATEAINLLFKSKAYTAFIENKKIFFAVMATDHSCVLSQKEFCQSLGHKFEIIPVDSIGQINKEKLLFDLMQFSGEKFVNLTAVNNESGVALPRNEFDFLRDVPDLFLHIDAAQLPFKLSHWNFLSSVPSAYTFSSHKFGGVKGHGFTLLRQSEKKIHSIISGGGQQMGYRSGTENILAAECTLLALTEGRDRLLVTD